MTSFRVAAVLCLCLSLAGVLPASAQSPVKLVGMGDSIGEGVQSGDANFVSQGYNFSNLIAWRMGASYPLPLISTGLFAAVGDTGSRHRLDPSIQSLNLAVSGADVHSILYDAADAVDPSQIDTETDLVLFPRLGSQIEIAERLRPEYVVCWIGNNDALGAALAFDHLDASQLTSIDAFTTDFTSLVTRLKATGTKAVFGTIPDISQIAFLVDGTDLLRFLGSSFGLAPGNRTSAAAMLYVRLGLLPTSVFADPNFVLDPLEQQTISARVQAFNQIIQSVASAHGIPVVDMNGIFGSIVSQGLNLFGVNLSTRFLGGLFSLDGVHPSDVGHALAAYFFIDALNRSYGAGIPNLDSGALFWFLMTDPFVDKDGDGRVMGRPGAGLLETIAVLIGVTGDPSDDLPAVASAGAARLSGNSTAGAESADTGRSADAALDEYALATGQDLRALDTAGRLDVLRRMFGLPALAPTR